MAMTRPYVLETNGYENIPVQVMQAVKAFAERVFEGVDCKLLMMAAPMQSVPVRMRYPTSEESAFPEYEQVIITAKEERFDVSDGLVNHINRAITNIAIELDKPPSMLIVGLYKFAIVTKAEVGLMDGIEYSGSVRYALTAV